MQTTHHVFHQAEIFERVYHALFALESHYLDITEIKLNQAN